jgi:hypothetical protein
MGAKVTKMMNSNIAPNVVSSVYSTNPLGILSEEK